MERFIEYKNSKVHMCNCTFKQQNHPEERICYICNNKFHNNDNCIILCNNHKYIPNMLLHSHCFNELSNNAKRILLLDIESNYKKFLELEKIFN